MKPGTQVSLGQFTALMLTVLSVIPCFCEKGQVDSNDNANDEVAALQVHVSSSKAVMDSRTKMMSMMSKAMIDTQAEKAKAVMMIARYWPGNHFPFGLIVMAVIASTIVALARWLHRRYTDNVFPHVMINGIFQPPILHQGAFDDLQANWQLRDSDIVISTYPKCGTTWMQQIVLLLQFNGDKDKVKGPMEQAPWIEGVVSGKYGDEEQAKCRSGMMGKPYSVQELTDWDGSTEEAPAPPFGRVFKTHCFAHDVPWKGGVAGHGKAKIIVVVRNPKDACISHYHHHKNSPRPMGAGVANIGVFAQRFFKGEVHHGDFWEWHAGWEKAAAKDSGIYWVSYEAIKHDPCCEIRKIAEFLGLEASDELVEKVAGKSSFSSMKEQFAENNDKLMAKGLAVKKDHIRNGQAGSWGKDIFGDLNSQFDEVHASKCAALGLKYQFDFGVA